MEGKLTDRFPDCLVVDEWPDEWKTRSAREGIAVNKGLTIISHSI